MHARCDFDVALIGFGPTGELLANLLGALGRRVVAFDRMPSVFHQPRAAHFDSEVMRILQSVGLADAVLADTHVARGMHFVNAAGDTLIAYDLPEHDSVHGWPFGFMFHQPQLEEHLRAGAARFAAVDVRLGVDVVAVHDEGDAVRVETDAGAVTAAFVVGCDGARSLVRRAIGASVDDLGCDQPWLVLDVVLRRAQDHLPPVAVQYCDPARPATFVPMPGDRRRYEIMLLPGDDPDAIVQPGAVRALLDPHLDVDAVDIERAAVYTFHALLASPWRRGRLLLAGDAAHQMPPFLGQGMCAGLRDGFNLAWKLDLVLAGIAEDRLLDTYESERAPHVRHIIESAVLAGSIVQTTDPELAEQRDAAFLAGAAPAPDLPRAAIGSGCRDDDREPVGTLLPQVDRSDDRLGPGFTLVGEPLDASAFPLPLEHWSDPPRALRAWLREHGARAAIVRPDRIVFGLVRDDADPTRLGAALATFVR